MSKQTSCPPVCSWVWEVRLRLDVNSSLSHVFIPWWNTGTHVSYTTWKDDSSDTYFCLSSSCGSPAMKSSMLRCRDNLILSPPLNVYQNITQCFIIQLGSQASTFSRKFLGFMGKAMKPLLTELDGLYTNILLSAFSTFWSVNTEKSEGNIFLHWAPTQLIRV